MSMYATEEEHGVSEDTRRELNSRLESAVRGLGIALSGDPQRLDDDLVNCLYDLNDAGNLLLIGDLFQLLGLQRSASALRYS